MLAMVLALGLAFMSCKADSEPTYMVWATTMPYSEWQPTFGGGGTLNDNAYGYAEVSQSDFNESKAFLPDAWKHDWTQDQIYTWFLEKTFGETTARMLASWLVSVDHGAIALRRGSQVHGIMK